MDPPQRGSHMFFMLMKTPSTTGLKTLVGELKKRT